MRNPTKLQSLRPVIFGEVLFDRFGDAEVLGGAPFNVAWHLRGFGLSPLMISRVGSDDRGRRVCEAMAGRGLATTGLQTDSELPTGLVETDVADGQPTFTILPDRAYDAISATAALEAVRGLETALLYHGTLALRDSRSGNALHALRDALAADVYIDVNLRAPWWDRERVRSEIEGARWIKLNGDELRELSPGPPTVESARLLAEQTGAEVVLVTLGADGVLAVHHGGAVQRAEAVKVDDLVDTVGAGDAFAAVSIIGLLEGWPLPDVLSRAARFAARVCRYRGALVHDEEVYAEELRSWSSS